MKDVKSFFVKLLVSICSFLMFSFAFPLLELWLLAWICLVPFFWVLSSEKSLVKSIIYAFVPFISLALYFFVGFSNYSIGDYLLFCIFLSLLFLPFVLLIRRALRKCVCGKKMSYISMLFCSLQIALVWSVFEFIRAECPVIEHAGALLIGYSQYKNILFLQFASIFGVIGMSFVIVFINAGIFFAVRSFKVSKNRSFGMFYTVLCLVLVMIVYGVMSMMGAVSSSKTIKVGVVQPNISLDFINEKGYMPEYQKEWSDIVLSEASTLALQNPDLMVFPEGLYPFYTDGNVSGVVPELYQFAHIHDVDLIVGGDYEPDSETTYNSSYYINSSGELKHRYDKVFLFPFVESLPGKEAFEWVVNHSLARYVIPDALEIHDEDGFIAEDYLGIYLYEGGYELSVFPIESNIMVGTPICIEDTIPSVARTFVENGAELLCVITNDAWLEDTPLVWHHFICSVFRAVENGVSVARAANGGVSGLIDSKGRILNLVKDKNGKSLMVRGSAIGELPVFSKRTFYNRIGHSFPVFCVFLLIVFYAYGIFRKISNK